EHHIVSSEGCAIRPFHVGQQLPSHTCAVGCHATVLDSGDLGGQVWHKLVVLVVTCQCLKHDRRAVEVFGTCCLMWIQDCDGLPVEDSQFASCWCRFRGGWGSRGFCCWGSRGFCCWGSRGFCC